MIFKSQHFCYISLYTGSYCIYLFPLICLSNFLVDEYNLCFNASCVYHGKLNPIEIYINYFSNILFIKI